MTKHIEVKLKTGFGTFKIGDINLNPDVIGDIESKFPDYISHKVDKDTYISISKVAMAWTQGEERIYLYIVDNGTLSHHTIESYFVQTGYLYDTQTGNYYESIEVGELLLKDWKWASEPFELFFNKVKEILD